MSSPISTRNGVLASSVFPHLHTAFPYDDSRSEYSSTEYQPIFLTSQNSVTRPGCHIGILVADGHFLAAVSAISRIFQLANTVLSVVGGQPLYSVSFFSAQGGHVISSSAIGVWTRSLDSYSPGDFHAVFIADNDTVAMFGSDTRFSQWLADADQDHSQRAQLLLDVDLASSQRPTTPVFWLGKENRSNYQSVLAAAQMAVAVVKTDHGEDISRRLTHRASLPVEVMPDPPSADVHSNSISGKIPASCRWMKENFGNDVSISDAAAAAAMSVRNYLRRFKTERGMTPHEYLTQLRLEAVCAMLVETSLPVDKIARHCGMGSGDRLGRLFRKRYDVSPTAYRRLWQQGIPGN